MNCRLGIVVLMLCTTVAVAANDLSTIDDWTYVLQPDAGVSIVDLKASAFDLVVLDYSDDGSPSGEFSAAEIAGLRDAGKVVLAYISIGEAGDFRFYWDNAWNDEPSPDPDAPSWLGPENPDFAGNFKVRYWDPTWQSLMFGTTSGPNKSYLDRILDQGFDGVYLDIVDAYEFWSDEEGLVSRLQARTDMVALVQAIADYTRITRGRQGFLVVPQNAGEIVYDDDELVDSMGDNYRNTIDAIGVEDVFYDETDLQPASEIEYRTTALSHYLATGKVVLSVDYVWRKNNPLTTSNIARFNDYEQRAIVEGYIPFAAVTDRELDEMNVVSAGGGLLYSQPKIVAPALSQTTLIGLCIVISGLAAVPFLKMKNRKT